MFIYLCIFGSTYLFITITIDNKNIDPFFSFLFIQIYHFFFIPDLNKGSPIEYKTNSACSTPTKDTLKSFDRTMGIGPVLPPRGTICGPPSHHYSAPLNFRKGLASKCTWKCTAIIVIMLSVVLMSTLIYITGKFNKIS